MIAAAVEARRRRAEQCHQLRCHDLGAEFQNAAFHRIALDDLDAHSGALHPPVAFLRQRIIKSQRGKSFFRRLHDLVHQILIEIEIMQTDFHHRQNVAGPDRGKQIEP